MLTTRSRSGSSSSQNKHVPLSTKTVNQHKRQFKKTSSELGNTLDVCRNQLKALKREIRADEEGKKEFEEQLGFLRRQREELVRRVQVNSAWAKEFDQAIGPFERK